MMLVEGNNFISHYIKNNTPFAAGKIGVTELNMLYYYISNGSLPEVIRHEVENIAGCYPMDNKNDIWFCKELLDNLRHVDLIAQWSKQLPEFEKGLFQYKLKQSYKCPLQTLEPWFFDDPWTRALDGKNVLVISPFKESIENNFSKLESIWSGKIKPNFNLKVLKYPFSLKLEKNEKYKTSKDIYEDFIEKIENEDFDVGIFGTGHTSLLFTIKAKLLGKQGIHLGGSTQILFGILGSRWDEMEEFKGFFNKFWSRPLSNEIPKNYQTVEGGCYW